MICDESPQQKVLSFKEEGYRHLSDSGQVFLSPLQHRGRTPMGAGQPRLGTLHP